MDIYAAGKVNLHLTQIKIKMKYLLWTVLSVILILINFSSCHKKEKVTLQAAREYCECMNENNYKLNMRYAFTVCEAELIYKYDFYRIEKVSTLYGIERNDKTIDSVWHLYLEFDSLVGAIDKNIPLR